MSPKNNKIHFSFFLTRAPDINTEQGKNILEILQDCFEEKIQAPEAHPEILATHASSKNTHDWKKMSSRKQNSHHNEADEEFYLSVGSPSVFLDAKTSVSENAISSIAKKRETYTLKNSVNTLSSSAEISLKPKKRLNFEDKDVLKKVEIENKISEVDKISEQPERKLSVTSQERLQDSEHEIQPQAKKSFSTLFLETVKRKGESSPIVRHIAPAPTHSSSPSDLKLLEDEFIIDGSERSFASRSWITIPRKAGHLNQRPVSPAENPAPLQAKKSREKHHSVLPETLTNGIHSHGAHPVEKSQPSDQENLCTNCALTDEMENSCRSTKYKMCSENAEKSPGNKRTVKQKQRTKSKDSIDKDQLDVGQSKDGNMSHIAQKKLQRNSDRNTEECEEKRNNRISKKQMPSMGSKNSTKKDKEESKKKRFSSGSKNKVEPEGVTLTVTRSRRISRCPSDWWVVKSEQSNYYNIRNLLNEESVLLFTQIKR
ncbi:Centromere protein C 1 [Tupaia chinensis]|uniref:Centromere protein C 1 n=1 Tax=Tupaia chinensis TaxID=246437 RepID=L8YCT1_TUPCH|nr:Centromere protein C 1 [Tupaia chinensis]